MGITFDSESRPDFRVVGFGPEVRSRVNFVELDIVQRPLPAPVDVAVVANVLLHYNEAGRQVILRHLAQSMAEGGWLVCERAEWMDREPERVQYYSWMNDLSSFGFQKQQVILPGYLLDDQTPFSQVYRRVGNS